MTGLAATPCYVFGIVGTDGHGTAPIADPGATPRGAGADEIRDVRLVSHGDIAAVVGTAPTERPLGRATDLKTHDRVLAGLVSAGTPVLPFRFGGVMTDEQAVVDELLVPNDGTFRAALERVAGRVQYTVTAEYDQDAVLREVLTERPEIARLRRPDEEATVTEKMQLGEAVVRALEEKRPADAAGLLSDIERAAVAVRAHEVNSARQVVHVAALVDHQASERFEQAIEACGARVAGRIRIRLVGPVAPYDFVEGP